MVFEIKTSNNNQFYFRIVSSNGRTLAHSETYNNRSDCEHAVELIRSEAGNSKVSNPYVWK